MKKKFVYVLFACLAMVNMALGQQNESRLALNPEVPVVGQSLELTYNPKGYFGYAATCTQNVCVHLCTGL